MRPSAALARRGEQLAAEHLTASGMTILARNWRCPVGELDVVAADADGTVVFVEVKARTSLAFGEPLEAVDSRKARRIRHLALRWLEDNPRPGRRGLRFDVVSVLRGTGETACKPFISVRTHARPAGEAAFQARAVITRRVPAEPAPRQRGRSRAAAYGDRSSAGRPLGRSEGDLCRGLGVVAEPRQSARGPLGWLAANLSAVACSGEGRNLYRYAVPAMSTAGGSCTSEDFRPCLKGSSLGGRLYCMPLPLTL